jgi:hypothetical protein
MYMMPIISRTQKWSFPLFWFFSSSSSSVSRHSFSVAIFQVAGWTNYSFKINAACGGFEPVTSVAARSHRQPHEPSFLCMYKSLLFQRQPNQLITTSKHYICNGNISYFERTLCTLGKCKFDLVSNRSSRKCVSPSHKMAVSSRFNSPGFVRHLTVR